MNEPAPSGASMLRQTLVFIPAPNESECVADTICCWQALGVERVRLVDNGSSDDAARLADAGSVRAFAGRRWNPAEAAKLDQLRLRIHYTSSDWPLNAR